MDVLFFLRNRTEFIRRHYVRSVQSFNEIIRKIEAGEEPFVPPYSEDGEPPFLSEWMDAKISIDLLGMHCMSILSESLKLYFTTWQQQLQIQCGCDPVSVFKAKGFIQGYRTCFGEALDLDWDECPVDFGILEQIVLVRNRGQHPDHVSSMTVRHSHKDREKYPCPFFIGEIERAALEIGNYPEVPWMNPSIEVTRDSLFAAIEQVESLGEWLEQRLIRAKFPA